MIILRIVHNDADALARIHRGTAADGDHEIRAGSAVCVHAMLHVFNRGVRFDVRIEFIRDAVLIKEIGHFFGHAELDQIRV